MNVPILDLKAQYAAIRTEIMSAIENVLEDGIYTLGPEVEKLEKSLSEFCNTPYAIATSNGTDSLLLALSTIDIQPGDEVITSPFSFFASAEVISYLRARPIFSDIDPDTFCINPSKIEDVITKKTRAIIPVHIFGQCADMESIQKIAKANRLVVIEDACQAIGAEYRGKKACSMGDFAALSFYPSKNLGTYGDGGMLFCKEQDHFKMMRELRTHGEYPKTYNHKRIGMNARMGAIEAAVLNVKFKYLKIWNEKRRKAAQNYYRLFEEANLLEKIRLPKTPSYNLHVYHLYVILTPHKKELGAYLKGEGIQTGPHFPIPIPYLDCYKDLGYRREDFPTVQKISEESLALPIYPEIMTESQEYVVSKIKDFYRKK